MEAGEEAGSFRDQAFEFHSDLTRNRYVPSAGLFGASSSLETRVVVYAFR